jgi:hypothetical protein
MKKQSAIVIMLIFIIFPLAAQKTKEALYLKNGSIIYGRLIEANETQYKFKTSDGSLFVYSIPEVEKIVNETPLFNGRKRSGIGFAIEGGLLVGAQSSQYKSPFSFNILGNVTVNTKNIIGLGSGVEFLGQPFTPLFLEYKYMLTERKTAPFIFVRGGKLFHLNGDSQKNDYVYSQYNYEKSYEGGGSFTIGTGISWAKDDSETYLSFAYRNVHTSYTERYYNTQPATYKTAYNRLEIKFGLEF